MFVRLFLLLTLMPIIELAVLMQTHQFVSQYVGWFPSLLFTIGVVVLTGFAGAFLAKTQGLGVLRRIQESLSRGEFPSRELVDGAMVLVGAVLLITPGFISDVIGLTLLLPATRPFYRQGLAWWFRKQIRQGTMQFRFVGPGFGAQSFDDRSSRRETMDDVIDVDVHRRSY